VLESARMEAEAEHLDRVACPSCGGAGGGPFGRAGSAWDDDEYVCPRCKGVGAIALDDVMVQSQRPGIVKAVPDVAAPPAQKKRKASA
jgi:ribosomal protein S27AE